MSAEMAESQTPRTRRRWFRYSLRSLLLLTAALAMWLGVQVNRATNQRRAVAMVKDRGGRVYYRHQGYMHPIPLTNLYSSSSSFDPNVQPPGPAWLRGFLGDEYFQDVMYVSLTDRVASEGDADAKLIARLPKLEYLDMGRCKLTDEALRYLGSIGTLRVLHVDRNSLTDDGLRHLGRTSTLESLAISSIDGIRGPGLRHLAGLSALKELDLQYVPLDCNWLQEIVELPLEKLMLSKTPLEDSHLEHVGRIRTLVILSIDRTNVTGAGLAKLANLKSLQQLYLNEAAALDGMEYLRQLPSLNYLGIETKNPDDSSESVLKRLRQALPGCQVNTL